MLTFRTATLNDLDELISLNAPKTKEKKEQGKILQKKRIEDALQNTDKEFLLVLIGNKIAGHVFVNYDGGKYQNYPQMKALLVDENLRNQGIGTEIIREVEKRVKEKGFNKIGLAVNPENNSKAKDLYERLGYKQTESEKYLEYVDHYDGVEDWVVDLFKEL